jgi:hypothetical protein
MSVNRLPELYRMIPDVACKGLCQKACGPIACSAIEADALRDNGINPPEVVDHPTYGPLTCSHLDASGRCSIYDHRPLVCRLFGAVAKLPCPFGCKPQHGPIQQGVIDEIFAALEDGRPGHFPEGVRP